MNIHAKRGTKVVFAHPSSGYRCHQKAAEKHLVEGVTYTVETTVVGGWHTDVYLQEVPDIGFNSVMFDEETGDGRRETCLQECDEKQQNICKETTV